MAIDVVDVLLTIRGTIPSWIVKGEDGLIYALQCHRVEQYLSLMYEVVGLEIYRLCGLPVPAWTAMYLPESVRLAHPELTITNDGRPIERASVWHFGMRLSDLDRGLNTSDVLPRSWMSLVCNRPDFAKALIIDLWMNLCSHRRALFTCKEGARSLEALFYGFGSAFGGESRSQETCLESVMMPLANRYCGFCPVEALALFGSRVMQITPGDIDSILENAPGPWAPVRELHTVAQILRERQGRLSAYISQAVHAVGSEAESLKPVSMGPPAALYLR